MNLLVPRLSFFILAFIVAASCSSEKKSSAESTQEVSSGNKQIVEQATFEDLEGNEVDLSEFEGKVVLIDFWETWCKPCLNSFPTMQKLMEDHPQDFVVLAVTPGFVDTREDARQFAEEHSYDFVYLYDANSLHKKLEVMGIPFKVYVDTEGEFIEMSMGSRGPNGDYQHAQEIIREHR